MRKGQLFRLDKLNYTEINDKDEALKELINANLVSELESQSVADWITLFNKAELVKAFNKSEWKNFKRKELELFVIEFCENHDIPQAIIDHTILFVPSDNFETYRLLFFGNLRQDLTEFVLQDLGLMTYESYSISDKSLAIKNRDEIDALKTLHELSELIHSRPEWTPELMDQAIERIPQLQSQSTLYLRRRSKIIYALARENERMGEYARAAEMYPQSQHELARERYIRCLEKLNKPELAWYELQKLDAEATSFHDKSFVLTFEKKLAKRLRETVKNRTSFYIEEQAIQLSRSQRSVELDVCDWLAQQGGVAYWTENSVFNTLFALIYWQGIFEDIEGAFYNPFQTQPADIYEPLFITRRESTLLKIRQLFQDGSCFRSHIRDTYQSKYSLACSFAHWQMVDAELLDTLLEKVPFSDMDKITQRILSSPKEFRSGQPDLIYFDNNGNYELIEVKGPGDRLQNNQKAWFDFYQKNNIPHRVIRVIYDD